MKHMNWQLLLASTFIALSAVLYLVHYLIFSDAHHVFIYLVGDIAFVPIEVLLVTIIIHRVLSRREKRIMLKKMNMVIGLFFSEVGTAVLRSLSDFDKNSKKITRKMIMTGDWSDEEFRNILKLFKEHRCRFDARSGDLEALKHQLVENRSFLLNLLGNPNLMEHETFTDLLWAVSHLTEELSSRHDLAGLPRSDLDHLAGDMKRAHRLLITQWIGYMKHLKDEYPYLFSLSMRMNPFDPLASPIVK